MMPEIHLAHWTRLRVVKGLGETPVPKHGWDRF